VLALGTAFLSSSTYPPVHFCWGSDGHVSRTKIILHSIISTLDFELAVPKEEVCVMSAALVMRPCIRSQMGKGAQLPLRMKQATVPAVTEVVDLLG
jgi:hypothetical protein